VAWLFLLGEEVRILVNYLKLCDSFDTGKICPDISCP